MTPQDSLVDYVGGLIVEEQACDGRAPCRLSGGTGGFWAMSQSREKGPRL